RDSVALRERVAGGVGLLEEQVSVQVEEPRLGLDRVRDVDDHRARLLEGDGELELLAELLQGPGDHLVCIQRLELRGEFLRIDDLPAQRRRRVAVAVAVCPVLEERARALQGDLGWWLHGWFQIPSYRIRWRTRPRRG